MVTLRWLVCYDENAESKMATEGRQLATKTTSNSELRQAIAVSLIKLSAMWLYLCPTLNI